MKSKLSPLLVNTCLLAAAALSCRADVALPSILSEHAVVQRSARTSVWGTAAAGESVTVSLGTAEAHTQAAADGRWSVNLDLHDSGPGPFVLNVRGRNQLAVADVLVGEVWVCSGQSNMELPLKASADAATEIAASANPQLREFAVKKRASLDPQDSCEGRWVVSAPDTAGGFSAVGYYFGQTLQRRLRTPVGLIHSSWGGTPIEAWMSADAFAKDPDLKASAEKYYQQAKAYPTQAKEYAERFKEWATRRDRLDHPADPSMYIAPEVPAAEWQAVTLPGEFSKQGLPDAGAIWLRCKIQVTAENANVPRPLFLAINEFDTVYWNGTEVGETAFDHRTAMNTTAPGSKTRRYNVPGKVVQAGENTLAIRLFVPTGHAGSSPEAHPVVAPPLTLASWTAKAEFSLPPLSLQELADCPAAPPVPTEAHLTVSSLYNGMIHPLLRYATRGALWYQGEQNTGRAEQYRRALLSMIPDWRAKWGEGDFPFFVCQLPNFQPKKPAPGDSVWAEIRESQSKALGLPNTGLATLIDLGEEGDVHPKNKRDVGDRLARLALARAYGQSMPFSGPVYRGVTPEGDKLRVAFANASDGLVAKPLPETYRISSASSTSVPLVKNSAGSELQGFAVCGADRQWHWAQARIDRDTVVVSAPEVRSPVAVRYAWADNPTCNLYGKSGLPAAPFRTDDFPLGTANTKY